MVCCDKKKQKKKAASLRLASILCDFQPKVLPALANVPSVCINANSLQMRAHSEMELFSVAVLFHSRSLATGVLALNEKVFFYPLPSLYSPPFPLFPSLPFLFLSLSLSLSIFPPF